MKLPEMIIFDYGGTLLYEPGFDPTQCERVAFEHLTANPLGLTVQEIHAHAQEVFRVLAEHRRNGVEIHQHHYMRLAYETLGLEFDIPYSQLEEEEWLAAAEGAVVPHADELLDYLSDRSIRTAVISNIGWSRQALENRLNRLLPRNRFEFVIASSDYGVRKPNRMLFEAALMKAGLPAGKVWYCGDTLSADIVGSHGAGMFPVHYTGELTGITYRPPQWSERPEIDFDYLAVDDWRKLIEILKGLK